MTDRNYEEYDVRVMDQRIGAGIGGMDTIIRILHKPSGIIVEIPRISISQFYDRELGFHAIDSVITHKFYRKQS